MTVMQIHSGLLIEPLAIRPDQISITDIAHSLSRQCRFNGHSNRFYSVAEHSCRVADVLEPYGSAMQLAGLLHDAGEAYYGDIVTPVKDSLPELRDILSCVDQTIMAKFGVAYPLHDLVHEADYRMLATEAMALLKEPEEGWVNCSAWFGEGRWPTIYANQTPEGWHPNRGDVEFMRRFYKFTSAPVDEKLPLSTAPFMFEEMGDGPNER